MLSVVVVTVCALLTAGLIVLLTPTLNRHFLAIPNDRSSHGEPVPQGAGLAMMGAMLVVYLALWMLGHLEADPPWPLPVLAGAVWLTVLGALDDASDLPVLWRLAGQAAAAIAVVFNLPDGFHILPDLLPLAVERTLLVIGIMAFINAVNFLDGIDWITAAQTVPMTAAVIVMAWLGPVPQNVGLMALVLLGATIGFGIFNKHPARIFLGDAGSLPLGLLLAWMLIFVARADIAAALLLPLYTLADTGVTLVRRARNGEALWVAHRSHFYQRALSLGFKAPDITLRVFLLGCLLAALSVAAVEIESVAGDLALLATGVAATAYLLRHLERGRA
ncbi:putative undecaprenyl-phosphate N-acetylglucosaminyl 1-phosphate transferase [Methyloligella halotolerans]|uniref:Putative undecaprenyl-phosphate N-acetylglucosaminyl 1-phosphate transferase n=1 Tax=Methyloligella halotolerans TaxID=1177755 RepID=A0A1E2RYF2_9HYPH|nr:putative undecaprenyl-phosphate N-acetylglucosaminyl 1-phosphate transferase [Methyloligella halotolerans]